MIRICTSLAKYGYNVQLIGRELPNSPILKRQPFQQKRFRLFFKKGKLFYLEYNVRLFFYLLFSHFDAVCSVDLDTLVSGFIISKIKSKPCIYDAHEYFTEVPEVINRPFIKKAWETVADFIIPKLKYAYTVCDSLAEIFYEKYKTPFLVIRNLPTRKNISSVKNKLSANFILIYQGVLNEGRGLEECLEAIEFMESVELWLAGEGDLSEQLRKMVDEKKISDKVIFHGRVSPDKLSLLTPQAHLGLNLLKNKGFNYYYSLANKTFDYMQAGIPSICMAFPEYNKLQQQTNTLFLINNLSPNEIADVVSMVRNDKTLYDNICENNKLAAKEWVWEMEEKKLFQFYAEIWQRN